MTIKEVREQRGITQLEMAEKLGISVACYCQYETGVRNIPADKMEQIAAILRIKNRKDEFFMPIRFALR